MSNALIVGVDGSEPSALAVDWAVAEAARHGLALRLVHGSLWDPYEEAAAPESDEELGSVTERVVSSASRRAARADPGVETTAVTVPADPVTALLQEAESAFAVVLGTRGRGGITGMLLGSTGLAVAARAKCPVVVVRGPSSRAGGGPSRVTLGVGGRGESVAAAAFAFREAEVAGAELHALHAWHHPARDLPGVPHLSGDASDPERQEAGRVLDEAVRAAALAHPGVTVRREAVEGRARNALLDASARSDLLVVGAHRRHGTVGMQLGPVSHAVLHHSACPVAVVPEEG